MSPVDPEVVHATCTNGTVVPPSITTVDTSGVSYVVEPDDLGDGSVDVEATVIATRADGMVWGRLPSGWTQVSETEASFTVTLVGYSCAVVVPVLPANHDAACLDGVLNPPTLTFAMTDGVTYAVDTAPPYAPGQSVVVTATLEPGGVGWPAELPPPWAEASATTATYTHTFDDVSCTPVQPEPPVVTPASCTDGAVVASDVTTAPTPGIVYTVEPAGPYDPVSETAVVVTARVADGYAWSGPDAATSGFASWRTVGSAPGGGPGPVDLPEGWTWVSPADATYTVTLPAAPPCPQVDATDDVTPTVASEPIPETGADGVRGQLIAAVLATCAGLLLVLISRRRATP